MDRTTAIRIKKVISIGLGIILGIGLLVSEVNIPVYASEVQDIANGDIANGDSTNKDTVDGDIVKDDALNAFATTDSISNGVINVAKPEELIHICIYLKKSVDYAAIRELSGDDYTYEERMNQIWAIYKANANEFISTYISGTKKEDMYFYSAYSNKISIKATKDEISVYNLDKNVEKIIIYELQLEEDEYVDATPTLPQDEPQLSPSSFLELKIAAMADLLGYKNPSDYRSAERKELEKILDAALVKIDEAYEYTQVEKIVLEAEQKLDRLKTDAQLKEEENRNRANNQNPIDQEPLNQEPLNQEPLNQEPLDKEPLDKEPLNQKPTDEQLVVTPVPAKQMELRGDNPDSIDLEIKKPEDSNPIVALPENDDEKALIENVQLENTDILAVELENAELAISEVENAELLTAKLENSALEESQGTDIFDNEDNQEKHIAEDDRSIETVLLIAFVSVVLYIIWHFSKKRKIISGK